MTILAYESPLQWPSHLPACPRGQQRNDHGFSAYMTMDEALGYLEEEVSPLQMQRVILSTDMDNIRVDRLRRKVGTRNGAALHLRDDGKRYVIACDRWEQLEHNIYAIHLVLRNMQNMERWGVASFAQMLNAFDASGAQPAKAAPASGMDLKLTEWQRQLGLGPTATLEDATAIYHRRAKLVQHNNEALSELNRLMDAARSALSSK